MEGLVALFRSETFIELIGFDDTAEGLVALFRSGPRIELIGFETLTELLSFDAEGSYALFCLWRCEGRRIGLVPGDIEMEGLVALFRSERRVELVGLETSMELLPFDAEGLYALFCSWRCEGKRIELVPGGFELEALFAFFRSESRVELVGLETFIELLSFDAEGSYTV